MHTRRHKPAPAAPAKTGPVAPAPARPVAAPVANGHTARPVTADDVRLRAYEKWERAGKPAGDGVQFWLEAEQELTAGA